MINPYLDMFGQYVVRQPEGCPWRWDVKGADQVVKVKGKSVTVDVDHPFWDTYVQRTILVNEIRAGAIEMYAHAVPTAEALVEIASFKKPVLEMGAGTGYWAWMLNQVNVSVAAFDINPQPHWTNVFKGNETDVQAFGDYTLLLCWPPQDDPMAANTLARYSGDTLVYIGEEPGGRCANDDFFSELERWQLVSEVDIPRWPSMGDRLQVWRRG